MFSRSNLKVFLIVFIALPIFLTVQSSFAAQDCDSIINQLKQMKKAQSAVQSSLIANHDMLADSLDSYSDALKSTAGRAHKSVEDNMAKAAGSIRERGRKGADLSQKLSDKTDELINLIEKCLK